MGDSTEGQLSDLPEMLDIISQAGVKVAASVRVRATATDAKVPTRAWIAGSDDGRVFAFYEDEPHAVYESLDDARDDHPDTDWEVQKLEAPLTTLPRRSGRPRIRGSRRRAAQDSETEELKEQLESWKRAFCQVVESKSIIVAQRDEARRRAEAVRRGHCDDYVFPWEPDHPRYSEHVSAGGCENCGSRSRLECVCHMQREVTDKALADHEAALVAEIADYLDGLDFVDDEDVEALRTGDWRKP